MCMNFENTPEWVPVCLSVSWSLLRLMSSGSACIEQELL